MFTDILIPFDGSEASSRALATAIDMGVAAKPDSVNITLLHVLRMSDPERSSLDVANLMIDAQPGAHKDGATRQQLIQEYFESFPENVDVQIVVKRGNPRDIICQYAHDNGIDCIVMGRRGIGGIRGTLGSVSAAVLRGTNLPVLVVA